MVVNFERVVILLFVNLKVICCCLDLSVNFKVADPDLVLLYKTYRFRFGQEYLLLR